MRSKLSKLVILTIVVLLNCLKTYAQVIPSTGRVDESDSNYVSIHIDYIRLANQKMIERNYLEEVNVYKDSIIVDYKNYISEYQKVTEDYKARLNQANKINEDLGKRMEAQKKATLICGTMAGTAFIGLIISCLIN